MSGTRSSSGESPVHGSHAPQLIWNGTTIVLSDGHVPHGVSDRDHVGDELVAKGEPDRGGALPVTMPVPRSHVAPPPAARARRRECRSRGRALLAPLEVMAPDERQLLHRRRRYAPRRGLAPLRPNVAAHDRASSRRVVSRSRRPEAPDGDGGTAVSGGRRRSVQRCGCRRVGDVGDVPHRDAENTGTWLRWAVVANAAAIIDRLPPVSLIAHSKGFHLALATDSQGGALLGPLGRARARRSCRSASSSLAAVGSLIAWIFQAGRFAEASGWPAARGRNFGVQCAHPGFVNLWWPYEAVPTLPPPGSSSPALLRWWLSYLAFPFLAPVGGAIIAGFTTTYGSRVGGCSCRRAFLGPSLVWFGWHVISATWRRRNGRAAPVILAALGFVPVWFGGRS